MSFLLRVELPDVPGSLGRVAAAIGEAGANIEAIEIVEHRVDGKAVDDIFLELPPEVMPDSVVSAINSVAVTAVLWISRYPAGASITRDLEVVEEMTREPVRAADRMVDLVPETFKVDWAMRLRRQGKGFEIRHRTAAAPDAIPDGLCWPADFGSGTRFSLPEPWNEVEVAGCPVGPEVGSQEEMIVIARRGGPQILDSEIARLVHLAGLAAGIEQRG